MGNKLKKLTWDDIIIEEDGTSTDDIGKSAGNTQQFNIMKTDDDKRLIFGWASVAIKVDGEQVVDHQKDMIDPEDLEEAVYEYVLNFRDGGEEHIPNLRKKARMVESCMFTKEKMQAMGIPDGIVPEGWWIGFYVDDDDAWEKVKDGTYQMFSIEGQGIREEVQDDEEVIKSIPTIAKSFNEIIEKFNPYHGKDGRFTSAGSGAVSFSGTAAQMRNYGQKKDEFDAMIAGKGADASVVAKDLVSAAAKREPEITKALQDTVAGIPGAELIGLEHRLKTEESLARKIRNDSVEGGMTPEQAASKMYDVNRYTISNNEQNLTATVKTTISNMEGQGYEVMRVKNTLGNPNAEYRGINMVVKANDGGLFELQFHTPRSLEVKEVNHKIYEQQRQSTTSRAEKKQMGQQMRDNAASIPTPDGIDSVTPFNNLSK